MDNKEEQIVELKSSGSQLRASKAYYERNKETIKAKALIRNNKYYATNETFREKCKENAKKNNKKYKEKIKELTEFVAKITELKIPNL